MNALQIKRIRSVFGLFAAQGDEFVARFYEQLFARAPEVRRLFPQDMAQQHTHLLEALVFTVRNLENTGELLPFLQDLGARHVQYGVRPEHYDLVIDVLLDTIAEFSGDTFDDQARADWREALELVSRAMQSGAGPEQSPTGEQPQ